MFADDFLRRFFDLLTKLLLLVGISAVRSATLRNRDAYVLTLFHLQLLLVMLILLLILLCDWSSWDGNTRAVVNGAWDHPLVLIVILVVLELVCARPSLHFLTSLHFGRIAIVDQRLHLHLVWVIPVVDKHASHVNAKSSIGANILHLYLLLVGILHAHARYLD